jgi:hypothetical protein
MTGVAGDALRQLEAAGSECIEEVALQSDAQVGSVHGENQSNHR